MVDALSVPGQLKAGFMRHPGVQAPVGAGPSWPRDRVVVAFEISRTKAFGFLPFWAGSLFRAHHLCRKLHVELARGISSRDRRPGTSTAAARELVRIVRPVEGVIARVV